MKCVRFWGTRGSLPVALTASGVRHKVLAALRGAAGRTFASDDEIERLRRHPRNGRRPAATAATLRASRSRPAARNTCSATWARGARPFAQKAIARHGPASPQTYHIFMSHVHWDHIMGFPFFAPAYIPGNRIRIYGGHAVIEDGLAAAAGARRRSRWIFRRCARTSSSSGSSRAAIRHRRDCASA